jgi:hypothetical protein
MKLIVKTNTEDLLVHAVFDKLIPQIKCIDDLGKPTISYPTRKVWVKEYEAEMKDGSVVEITIYIRKINGGISMSGSQGTIKESK